MGRPGLGLCLACLLAAAAHAASIRLMLEVVIDGRDTGQLARFELRGAALYAASGDLTALGLHVGRQSGEIPLSALRQVHIRLDQRSQTLFITAPLDALATQTISAARPGGASGLAVQSGLGGVLNYDVADNEVLGAVHGPRQAAEAVGDLRLFSPWGLIDASGQASNPAPFGGPAFERLDTNYSFADAGAARRYQIGDLITDGFAWSRPLRLAGGAIGTDFALRPDLVTFPVPSIAGAVAVPSSLDVMVDGVQMFERDIVPGPFDIVQLPVVNGSGDVALSVRDATGTVRRQDLPIYANTALLAPGLIAYSAEAGVLRRYYGTGRDRYGAPAMSASLRRGMLDWLTLEAHGEASGQDTQQGVRQAGGMAGAGVDATLGRLGAVSLNAAGSRYGGTMGVQMGAGWERIGPRFTLDASMERASPGFADIAAANGDPVPRLRLSAAVGASLGGAGSIGLSYAAIRRPALSRQFAGATPDQAGDDPGATGIGLSEAVVPQAQRVSLLAASYSLNLLRGRAAFYVTGFHDFAGNQRSGVSLGISVALGPRLSAGAGIDSGQGDTGATLQAQQATPDIGDWGGRTLLQTGTDTRALAVGEVHAPFGLFDLGADRTGPATTLRATAMGSIAAADGAVFATDTIDDSFAVVDTAGTPGITVLDENRPIGRTDASGRLLLTDLRSFDGNRIGIDPADVPADDAMTTTEQLVRPGDRTGVVVRFAIRPTRGATVTLVDANGTALPIGALTQGWTPRAEVGFDGEIYLTNLQPHNRVRLRRPDGSLCEARFAYQPRARRLVSIGRVPCRAVAS